jgi:hypothetical protein
MPSSSLTVTIANPRIVDGWTEAAIRNNSTPEELAAEFLINQGKSYADLFGIGIITSATFMARFTPMEYMAIMTAAQQSPELAALVSTLTASSHVVMDDARLAPGLQALVDAGLLGVDRVPQLLNYARPGAEDGPMVELKVIELPAAIEPEIDVEPEMEADAEASIEPALDDNDTTGEVTE